MTYRIAFPMLALLAASACSDRGTTGPTTNEVKPSPPLSVSENRGEDNDGENSRRSGPLHVTKECTQYTRLAGGFCTITSSSLKQIAVGTKVIYLLASGPTVLDTDVILQPPKGKSVAYGHVVLALAAGVGHVTITGGTGKFRGLEASVDVARVGEPALRTWNWDGTYRFRGHGRGHGGEH